MPRVTGERVLLREYRAEDIGDIRKWVNDPVTTRYLSTRFWPAQTMVDSEEFLSRMLQSSHNAYNFVIADLKDERYIGQLDMFRVDWRLRCGELGMVIGDAGDRGRGIGTYMNALSVWLLKTHGMKTAYLTTDDWRIPAIKSYLRAGFTPDLSTDDFRARWEKILSGIGKR